MTMNTCFPPVRAARSADLEALWALENNSFFSDRLSRRSLRHLLRGKHSACLVAADNTGALVGYVLVLFRRGSSLARIYSIAVAPTCRSQGLGKRLLIAAEQAARQQKCLFIRLEVRHDNQLALAFYRAQGYQLFSEEPDYYEDGATALRLEKSLLDQLPAGTRQDAFYAQTTPFTCGPASLMMAMHRLNPAEHPFSRRTEMQLWREATTIFMTAGHGGCSPEGLALSAWQRGFAVTLYMQCGDIPFIDSVRDVRKKNVIQLVHEDFVERIGETDIELHSTAISPEQFQAHLSEGAALITLISTWRLNRNKAPHWVFVTGSDSDCVYLNDPDSDEDSPHPLHDNIGLPIRRGDFERMACFGSSRLKATLVLRRRLP